MRFLDRAGAPLVIDFYGRGQFEWADQNDALATWAEIRPYVLTREPTAKQLSKHEFWNAGIWEARDEHSIVYLVGYC